MSGGQVLRFRLTEAVDPGLLITLPQVRDLRTTEAAPGSGTSGTSYVVRGTAHMTQAVLTTLTRQGVLAHELRVDRGSLDDAFVALVGKDAVDAATFDKEEAFS